MRLVRWPTLAALAAGMLCSVSQAQAGEGVPCCTQPKTWHENLFGDIFKSDCGSGHVRLWGEGLYMSARGVDLAFGVPVDGCETLIPRGSVAIIAPDYELSYRAGFEVSLSHNASIGGAYLQYDTENQFFVTAPPGTFLHSLVTIAGESCDEGNVQDAVARYNINLKIADLEARYKVCGCDGFLVNLLVGARYGHLEQEFGALFSILGTTGVASSVIFDGVGPRIGVELEFLVCHGLGVYAKSSASFLMGEFNTHYTQVNTFEGLQATVDWVDRRIVPILEFEAGVSWTSCNEHFRVSAGYFVSSWLNVETIPGAIANLKEGKFNGREESIEFDGAVGRVEFRY